MKNKIKNKIADLEITYLFDSSDDIIAKPYVITLETPKSKITCEYYKYTHEDDLFIDLFEIISKIAKDALNEYNLLNGVINVIEYVQDKLPYNCVYLLDLSKNNKETIIFNIKHFSYLTDFLQKQYYDFEFLIKAFEVLTYTTNSNKNNTFENKAYYSKENK